MSKKEPLYFVDDLENSIDMDLRDYFATSALIGILSNCTYSDAKTACDEIARDSFIFADAMMKEKKARKNPLPCIACQCDKNCGYQDNNKILECGKIKLYQEAK